MTVIDVGVYTDYGLLFFSIRPVSTTSKNARVGNAVIAFHRTLRVVISRSFFAMLVSVFFLQVIRISACGSPPVNCPGMILEVCRGVASFYVYFQSLER